MAVILSDVCKSYSAILAVDHLNVSVPTGSIYGFIGPNGAGKTTTIRMIMNIIYPDAGKIEILGGRTADCIRRIIGYMPEERGLYRKMTVRHVLTFLGEIKGMLRAQVNRQIPEWLEWVNLSDWIDRRVEDLSKGMQQKLQFVATVLHDPQILILDEPFSGLDPVNTELLKDILLQLRRQGKTIIFSTHMMEQAEKLCDFILLVNRGRKIIDGTLDQIRSGYVTNAVYLELDGPADFVSTLPMVKMVKNITSDGRRLEITINDGYTDQDLLQAVVSKARVKGFEIKIPSLHEIFVHLVGRDHA